MNVTTDALREYIMTFHETLQETSTKFLPPENQKNLLHIALLPARILGYVSTQFGVAIEYSASTETVVEVLKGSCRIEELLLKPPKILTEMAPMFNFGRANYSMRTLTMADGFPFRLLYEDTNLTIGDICFRAGPWKRIVEHAEISGNRKIENWNREKAVSRAKDEILAALVELRKAESIGISLYDYIGQVKDRTVLVLGAYDEFGVKRLSAISAALKDKGYNPILIKDIPDLLGQDLSQKVVTIGSISRFIVVDDSEPSGHIMEIDLCRINRWVTVLLRAEGKGSTWMTAGASLYSNVMYETAYDPSEPKQAIDVSTAWAEERLKEIKSSLSRTYPWRLKS
jgi:hypothetical protein